MSLLVVTLLRLRLLNWMGRCANDIQIFGVARVVGLQALFRYKDSYSPVRLYHGINTHRLSMAIAISSIVSLTV